jgi:hypothetical protein
VNWLKKSEGEVKQFVSTNYENSSDTFGCGIDKYWPCNTTEWAHNHLLISGNTIVVDR